MDATPANGAEEHINRFSTPVGMAILRTVETEDYDTANVRLTEELDRRKGIILSSNFEFPGRYTRWGIGFCNPPVSISSIGNRMTIKAENVRGRVLLAALKLAIETNSDIERLDVGESEIVIIIRASDGFFPEELRSKQPSVFSILRTVIQALNTKGHDDKLGLYGAFAYSLAYQFENVNRKVRPEDDQRELVLFIPDQLLIIDHYNKTAVTQYYEFEFDGSTTAGLPRTGNDDPYTAATSVKTTCDHEPGAYVGTVREAIEAFRKGDLFEVVPGQTFFEPCPSPPSTLFERLQSQNPAPYSFIMNLGEAEYLVGASPEMYVRVTGQRVETAPISGTIKRGNNPFEDANAISTLLSSKKDEAELTMCTDVDRNDKSRVCKPGTVQVLGRRQVEVYSKVIHTVDHVEGILQDGFDAIDAFLAHTWAVTVTGAPKKWAMQFIEDYEKSPRYWYGGAVGLLGFDGDMNTGLTLRTLRLKDGVASVRAGATLLFDSVPEDEETETRMKASALLNVVRNDTFADPRPQHTIEKVGFGSRLLFIDYEDSFVHTLANYFRQTGADVVTWRHGFNVSDVEELAPDAIVLSPGPGKPSDFGMSSILDYAVRKAVPVFGICLGLQAIVEHFGGTLDTLGCPMHGKPSTILCKQIGVFEGLPRKFEAGRYHSLYANRAALPSCLLVTAETEDGIIMGVAHRTLPIEAVQFHPESVLSLTDNVGMRIVANATRNMLAARSEISELDQPVS